MKRRPPRPSAWVPAPDAGALHAAAAAIALCNTSHGTEMRLWIVLCGLRDQALSWVEILAALRQEMAATADVSPTRKYSPRRHRGAGDGGRKSHLADGPTPLRRQIATQPGDREGR